MKRSKISVPKDVKVEVVSDNKAIVYVPEKYVSRIIGKQGRNIEDRVVGYANAV